MTPALSDTTRSSTVCTGLSHAMSGGGSFPASGRPVADGASTMTRYKLKPLVTLHHFVHPTWFEDMGAFTKEENIPAFVAFCRRVFRY